MELVWLRFTLGMEHWALSPEPWEARRKGRSGKHRTEPTRGLWACNGQPHVYISFLLCAGSTHFAQVTSQHE